MIARILLTILCIFGLLLGVGFIAGGIYCASNTSLLSGMADEVDLSSVPRASKLKQDIVKEIDNMAIMQTLAGLFLTTGCITASISVLGLAAAITAWIPIVIVYIVVMVLMMLTFLIIIFLLVASSLLRNSITGMLVKEQNSKFVSIVALLDNRAGDGTLITIAFNFMQFKLGCCGMRSVGDIRDSPRWQASPRGLVSLLKLKDGVKSAVGSVGDGGKINIPSGLTLSSDIHGQSDDGLPDGVPDWIRNRIPPGATLPPGIDLPDKLPDGIKIPKKFNISDFELLKNVTALRQMFEKSLELLTPISCCRFKSKDLSAFQKPKELVASLEDPDCPFRDFNGPGVHSDTCYDLLASYLKEYSAAMVIFGISIGFMLTCNLSLALLILLCG